MALNNQFQTAAATYSQADVDALIGDIDRDPANIDNIFKFGNALYGQVPFPAALFKAAKLEVLRRYSEEYIPQAAADLAAAERMHSRYYDRDGNLVPGDESPIFDARNSLQQLQTAKEQFIEKADQNQTMLAHVANEEMKARQAREQTRIQREKDAADAAFNTLQALEREATRIKAVTGQIGNLNQPVTAPKVAKFKPRVAIPSR